MVTESAESAETDTPPPANPSSLKSGRQKRCGVTQIILGVGELACLLVFGSTIEKWDSLYFSVLASTFIGFSLYTLSGTLGLNAAKVTKHHRWVSACLAFSVISAIHTVFNICICASVVSPAKDGIGDITFGAISGAGFISIVELFASAAQMLESCSLMDKWYERKEQLESTTAEPPTYEEIFVSATSRDLGADRSGRPMTSGVPVSDCVMPGNPIVGLPQYSDVIAAKYKRGKLTEPPPSYEHYLRSRAKNEHSSGDDGFNSASGGTDSATGISSNELAIPETTGDGLTDAQHTSEDEPVSEQIPTQGPSSAQNDSRSSVDHDDGPSTTSAVRE